MTNNESRRGRLKDSAGVISAIAALITALVGLGAFLVGKGTKDVPAAATTTVTVVSTVPGTGGTAAAQPTERPTTPPPPAAEPGVRFAGEVVFGRLNLDFTPPKLVDTQRVEALAGKMLYVRGDHVLAEWTKPEAPGKAECAAQVSAEGRNQVDNLVKGSVVCGRTPEGRVFRLDVLGSGSEIRADATVWEK